MAPNRENLIGSVSKNINKPAPSRISMESLQRTISDISLELSKLEVFDHQTTSALLPISEVEDVSASAAGYRRSARRST